MSRHDRRISRRRARHAALAGTSAVAVLALGATHAQAATFTVTTTADAGTGSLRNAISQANANSTADTIAFASSVSGTVNLASGLTVSSPVQIKGPGAGALTLSGPAGGTVLSLTGTSSAPVTAGVSGLTVTGGLTGVAVRYAAATLEGLSVTGNGPTGTTSVGDGIDDDGGGSLLIERSSITQNRTNGSGGGVRSADPTRIIDSTVTGNTASQVGNGEANGGGVFFDGDATIESSLIAHNTAVDGGGVYAFERLDLLDSTVTGNTASGRAGGVETGGPTGSDSEIAGSTITANTAATAGGVYNKYDALPLESTVVAGNTPGDLGQKSGASFTSTASLVQNPGGATLGGSAITGQDPKLGPLQDNGGLTLTLAPGFGSPLLDAGKMIGDVVGDQRGQRRTVDLPGIANASDGTDIGAVEAQSAPVDPNAPPPVVPPTPTVTVTTPAATPPPPPPPPPPVVRCVVPRLAGLSVSTGAARLKAAHCAAGTVKRPKGKTRHGSKLVIASSSPAAGAAAPNGAKVSVVLKRVKAKKHRR